MGIAVEDVSTPLHADGPRGYRLAAGTELIGEYQDSGLRTPRYLVRRADGQVMQLPLLLYRVAGSLDGRDAGRIATQLSAELGRELTADQVACLVGERLRPTTRTPTARTPRSPSSPTSCWHCATGSVSCRPPSPGAWPAS
jgi:hypothetical protein